MIQGDVKIDMISQLTALFRDQLKLRPDLDYFVSARGKLSALCIFMQVKILQ